MCAVYLAGLEGCHGEQSVLGMSEMAMDCS
jgi:hypothetical protein